MRSGEVAYVLLAHGQMHRLILCRRALCPIFDAIAWSAVWLTASFLVGLVLAAGVDDTGAFFGVLLIVAFFAALPALVPLALLECATGRSAGRSATGLRLVGSDGGPLALPRRAARALLKYGAIGGLLALGTLVASALAPGEESLVVTLTPLALSAIANAATCARRADHRSILDVLVGSASTA